jgi:hypothetical protein
VTKHLDVYEVSPWTRVSAVLSTLAQIKKFRWSEPGLNTAGSRGFPVGRPPSMLVDARFIQYISVELLLVGFRAGFMPQWPQLLYTAGRAGLSPISPLKRRPNRGKAEPLPLAPMPAKASRS